jgi:hypothetical protein
MHGTLKNIHTPSVDEAGGGWEPYIPGSLSRQEVRRQIGHTKFVYCMRKRTGWWRYLYRECTPAEFSDIEQRDAGWPG